MEPFKNLINPALVRGFARELARRGTDEAAFLALALPGLEALELKARATHVAVALAGVLPTSFEDAAALLELTLAPIDPDTHEPAEQAAGVKGWIVWPMTIYVATRGAGNPERALQALHAMTQRFTSEWAIRTFVAEAPEITFRVLQEWVRDPSPHVRRLVSEGTRPRLPWGLRLKALVADPRPALPLLQALRDDPSEYVRRSVANHLNDIAKDHPVLFAELVHEWMQDAPETRVRLLKHASRTAIKAGDARVLQAFGAHRPLRGHAKLQVSPVEIRLGEAVTLTLTLESSAKASQKLVVDYVVHHQKKGGTTTPKVFKGWTLELAPGERRTLVKKHSVRPITTRTYYAGAHAVECLVNGRSVGRAPFVLALA